MVTSFAAFACQVTLERRGHPAALAAHSPRTHVAPPKMWSERPSAEAHWLGSLSRRGHPDDVHQQAHDGKCGQSIDIDSGINSQKSTPAMSQRRATALRIAATWVNMRPPGSGQATAGAQPGSRPSRSTVM